MPSLQLRICVKFGKESGWSSRMTRKQAPTRRTGADVADKILELLKTGKPRNVKEVAEAVDLHDDKLDEVLDFLTQTGLIIKRVQITDSGSNFLTLPVEKRKRSL